MPPLSSITDDFPSLDPAWGTFGTVTVSGNKLRIAMVPNAFGGASRGGDLAFDSVVLRAEAAVAGAERLTVRVARDSGNSWYGYLLDGATGELHCESKVAGVTTSVASPAYSATNHAWLRLRVSGANVLWDASPDGLAWTQLATVAGTSLASTDWELSLGCGDWTGTASGEAAFSKLNLAPPPPDLPSDPVAGFNRTSSGALAVTTDATDARPDRGFLRSPTGKLVVATIGTATPQRGFMRTASGALLVELAAGTHDRGFARSASGALAVSTGAGSWSQGFLRDASGSLVVAGL